VSWSRRDFLAAALAAAAASALPHPLRAAAGAWRSPLREIRRGVGVFTARGGTVGWLVGPAGTVVVDSQYPEQARDLLAALRERGVGEIEALVNTHHHGDHTAGNAELRPAVRRIVAHERVPALQRAVAEANPNAPEQSYADTTFSDQWSVAVGDETVSARHYGAAHTGGDCVVHFQEADVAHVGDLVFHGAYPFVDRRGGASVAGWVETLERVAARHGSGTRFVFGHAAPGLDVVGTRDDVLAHRDFLAAVLEAATRARAAGTPREELVARQTLPGFEEMRAIAEWLTLGSVLGAAYDEIA
jgi:cyclase